MLKLRILPFDSTATVLFQVSFLSLLTVTFPCHPHVYFMFLLFIYRVKSDLLKNIKWSIIFLQLLHEANRFGGTSVMSLYLPFQMSLLNIFTLQSHWYSFSVPKLSYLSLQGILRKDVLSFFTQFKCHLFKFCPDPSNIIN